MHNGNDKIQPTYTVREEMGRHRRGVCLWFTGLSGAGKTTTAAAVQRHLEAAGLESTVLDGDNVRRALSPELGFSKSDRNLNVRRVTRVAREIVHDGGIAICALISPYREARAEAKTAIGEDCFVEIFVDTPLAICEERDTKGLYARARRGELAHFTGITDPYEAPTAADLVLDTVNSTIEENVQRILAVTFARLREQAGLLSDL